MKYGYARTSTDDQTTALQLAALKRARCSHIYEDKGLTGVTANRPALSRCLNALRAGDTLIVWKLDRLGRSATSEGWCIQWELTPPEQESEF
jgi:DNA invertase Pin-like site-specific DNA recombinase